MKILSCPAAVKGSQSVIPLGNWEGAKTMNLSRNTCQHLGIHFTEYKVVLVSILGLKALFLSRRNGGQNEENFYKFINDVDVDC